MLPISEIMATTIDARSRKAVNNIGNNNALLSHMRKKNGGKMRMKPYTGGDNITETVILQQTTAGFYRGGARLDISNEPTTTMAKFPLALAYAQISFTGEDELKNDGRARMINLIGTRTEAGVSTLENIIAEALYEDGSDSNLYGLSYFLTTTPENANVGGIPGASKPNWRNQVVGGLNTTMGSSNVNEKINEGLTAARVMNMMPDCGFVDNATWLALIKEAQLQQRFGDGDKGSMGFKTLDVSGCDIYPDGGLNGHVPAQTIFLVNSKHVHYRPAKSRHFTVQKQDKAPVDMDMKVRYVLWAGGVTMDSLRSHVRVHAG